MNRACVALLSAVAIAIGCAEQKPSRTNPLQGTWRVASMQLISAEQDTVGIPAHESLVMFGDGYYSIAYSFGGERSPTYAERWHPTDREKLARFSSLIVNAGSYVLNGSRVEAGPLFAIAPEFVAGEAIFSYQVVRDTLELTWEKSVAFDGLEYPSDGTVTLLRLVRVS
jgi:hypothetical protein